MNERMISFHDAIEEGFIEEFIQNPDIIMIGEDIRGATEITLPQLRRRFPDRIINRIPLVEEMLGGIALGMSIGGLKPVIQINWSGFLTLLFDGIYRLGNWRYRMAEKDGPGALIRVGHEGYGFFGGAELSASFLASILHLPNIVIATPASPYYAKGLLKTALRSPKTVIFWEHKRLYQISGNVPDGECLVPFGSSSILKTGRDLTIISWSFTAHLAKQAADELIKDSISAEVVALHTINPLDMETIAASVQKTNHVVIVEEDMLRGGIGGEIGAQIVEKWPKVRLARVAAKNIPILSGYYNRFVLPDTNAIISACKKILKN